MWISPLWQALQATVRQSKQTLELFRPTGRHTHKQLTQLCQCLPAVSLQYLAITNAIAVHRQYIGYLYTVPCIQPPLYLIGSTTL